MRSKFAALAVFALVTVLTILVDRYVSTPTAVVVLIVCLAFLTWHFWKKVCATTQELKGLLRARTLRLTVAILLAVLAALGASGAAFFRPYNPPIVVPWKPRAPNQEWATTQKIETQIPIPPKPQTNSSNFARRKQESAKPNEVRQEMLRV
jgi:hypothetical protein